MKHWAYRAVQRPVVPAVSASAWCRNVIDRFVLRRLEARGLRPAPPAAKRALLRRAYLDVVGFPPSIAQQRAFLADQQPGRWLRVVDALLAGPAYGERWGRHWLDLVRYAETNGYERDAAKPQVWRYRDYVIAAFNEDKPYDRFVLEQLAGDELPDASVETVIATGHYRLGPWDDEPADPKQDRFDQLDDIVRTTSEAFLAMTLGCARCHDHKYDPLTMEDYYRLVAVFNPLQRPRKGRTELAIPAATGILSKRPRTKTKLPLVYVLREPSPQPPATHLLLRGRAAAPGGELQPGMPDVLIEQQPQFLAPDEFTSRRRLTLARWIVSRDNPLTARVVVNRVWQHHFGQGLVRSPSDFGVMGAEPTHAQLLNWLAHWFMHDADWSLKKLHRLIMTSSTYQMSKLFDADHARVDPDNGLLWRFPYRRLEVEALRDSMLAVSGQLNRQMGGPGVYLHVPRGALEGHSDPDKIWKPFNESQASRRTVYAFVKRSLVVPMLEVLDLCDTTRSVAQRTTTHVAPQALTLFNGDFVNRQARHLAARLRREAGDDPRRQIEHAFELALCRLPTSTEWAAMREFLEGETGNANLEQLCRVILNLNEFAYTD